jgi:hypothetical protein
MLIAWDFQVRAAPPADKRVWDLDQILGYPIRSDNQPNGLCSAIDDIEVRATVLSDLGNPLVVSDAEQQWAIDHRFDPPRCHSR